MSQTADQKWQRRKEERPAEIMSAALTLFAEKGFSATRLEDVAEVAGVSKATIYLYFDSKIELFLAIVREIAFSRFDEVEAIINRYDGSSRDLIRILMLRIREIAATSHIPAIARIVLAEAQNFPEIASFYRDKVILRGLGLVGRIVERGTKAGEFRACDPLAAAQSILFPVILNVIGRKTFGEIDALDPETFFTNHVEFVLRGLAADKEALQ